MTKRTCRVSINDFRGQGVPNHTAKLVFGSHSDTQPLPADGSDVALTFDDGPNGSPHVLVTGPHSAHHPGIINYGTQHYVPGRSDSTLTLILTECKDLEQDTNNGAAVATLEEEDAPLDLQEVQSEKSGPYDTTVELGCARVVVIVRDYTRGNRRFDASVKYHGLAPQITQTKSLHMTEPPHFQSHSHEFVLRRSMGLAAYVEIVQTQGQHDHFPAQMRIALQNIAQSARAASVTIRENMLEVRAF